mmetsp:Transcript_57343/g.68528  ORF Transcript_57343/g.68528 Transcript_57343/m.68528 type:complete len:114 (-) Transcript_57343:110-451(-)
MISQHQLRPRRHYRNDNTIVITNLVITCYIHISVQTNIIFFPISHLITDLTWIHTLKNNTKGQHSESQADDKTHKYNSTTTSSIQYHNNRKIQNHHNIISHINTTKHPTKQRR